MVPPVTGADQWGSLALALTGHRRERGKQSLEALQPEIETLDKLHETRASKNLSCADYWLKQNG